MLINRYPTRILLVENNPVFANLIQTTLRPWSEAHGLRVDVVTTVEDAIKKLSEGSYNLVITDYDLPDRTALDFLSEIKLRKLGIPVLLMATSTGEELSAKALEAGFSEYILKTEEQISQLPRLIEAAYERHFLRLEEAKLREELAQKDADLSIMSQYLAELSVRDELTGLYNHRFLQEKIAEEFARVLRYHYSLACLMVDLDHFKSINDMHGHPIGDQVLKELSQLLLSQVRETDTVARFGGEEFVILLPHIGYEGAHVLAERLRKEVMAHVFVPAIHRLQVTVSIGVSAYPEDPVDSKDTIVTYADRALYRAKGSGRNKVCMYRDMSKEFQDHMPELKLSDDRVVEFRRRLVDISELAKQAYIDATKALINALEAKDSFTLGHAERVAQYSVLTARHVALPEEDIRIVEHAGLLHDIGKICIPDEILLKKGRLDRDEYEKMKAHALLGYQIVRPIKFLAEESLIILHHHEWYSGAGYPHRLRGREIPIGARIVSIADAYDTIRQAGGRYKETRDLQWAVGELINCSGTQFDPEVLAHFIQVLIEKGELQPNTYDQRKLEESLKSVMA